MLCLPTTFGFHHFGVAHHRWIETLNFGGAFREAYGENWVEFFCCVVVWALAVALILSGLLKGKKGCDGHFRLVGEIVYGMMGSVRLGRHVFGDALCFRLGFVWVRSDTPSPIGMQTNQLFDLDFTRANGETATKEKCVRFGDLFSKENPFGYIYISAVDETWLILFS